MYHQGDIVIVPFHFADSSQQKKRPAIIISNELVNNTGDYLMAQVTSKQKTDGLSLQINQNDFYNEPLAIKSFIRCHKIFLLNETMIIGKKTSVNKPFLKKLNSKINSLIEI